MLSNVQDARNESWIKTDEQLSRIKVFIEGLKARKKRQLESAVNEIERYVSDEVRAGRMTSEADALVRLNALYLLKRVEKDPQLLRPE